MQLDFKDLQTTQRDLIDARAFFDDVEVLVDDGNQTPAIEAQLREIGVCIVVCPALTGSRGSQATHELSLRAENVVKLFVNPKRNADPAGAQLGVLESIREIVVAVLGYGGPGGKVKGERFFETPEDVFALNTFDPGLWVYDVFFVKNFVFA